MNASTTVRDAMLTRPHTHSADLTVAQARAVLADTHVRLLLIVEGGTLLGALDRADLDRGDLDRNPDQDPVSDVDDRPALPLAGLAGRTVRAEADLDVVRAQMRDAGRRRLAVLDERGDLVGLLCLKASATGFCTDEGVAARARERARG